jgi:hypothetical protein
MATKTAPSWTFLLSRRTSRVRQFAALRPEHVSSPQSIGPSLEYADKNALWISDEKSLTDALLKAIAGHPRALGNMVLLHRPTLASIPVLATCFKHLAFSVDDGFLPPEELAEALCADNKAELFIGGSIDPDSETMTLWRGHLEPLTVPFTAFPPSGDGIVPDFSAFAVTDYGHSVRLGAYEAATDVLLYEFDPDYRRRIGRERRQEERSFGSSLRRLRKQRGLHRADFAPLSPKTIARIEQGAVDPSRIHPRTLSRIATRLAVDPGDIATY